MAIVFVKAIRGRRRVLTRKVLQSLNQLFLDASKGYLDPIVTSSQIITLVNPLITVMESALALKRPKG